MAQWKVKKQLLYISIILKLLSNVTDSKLIQDDYKWLAKTKDNFPHIVAIGIQICKLVIYKQAGDLLPTSTFFKVFNLNTLNERPS